MKASIVSSTIGNILEWYDFGLFTLYSALFSRIFFPITNPHTAMIATFSIFAIGFFCRPVGALIFGYLGDKIGRARTLRLSILMISLPTLLIGFLPTYHQIGIAAPILLTLVRMWQGISIGGEYSGNVIYLAEVSPKKHRAFFASLASMGANLGILLAGIVGIISTQFLSEKILSSWGWRIPYLLSGIISILIYQFRLRIQETNVFERLKIHHQIVNNPISTVFEKNLFELLRTLGLVLMGSTFYYFCFIYIPVYLTEHEYANKKMLPILMTFFVSLMIFLAPMAGWICDRIGRRKMFLFNASFIFLIIVPGFYMLQHDYFLIAVLFVFTLASSSEQGVTLITIVENFPAPARYTGLSLAYNIGNGFLGGTVPIICAWLLTITGFTLAPAFYIAFCTLITLLVVFFFVPETKGKSLNN
ncbi:MAG: hypothetical protein ACD_46C00187G0001 [uncultured bacterium]|nr:MAG: hypothetical protein ACD_46C00187G0001 [uncultured bacterium]